jgi:AcrR family transcriptional regulator
MTETGRERLFDAMLLELAERGYEEMVVTDALVRSGISETEFDAAFADKDACLFAAYEQLTGRLIERATERCDSDEDWPDRVQQGVEALLSELAASPQMALVVVRSFPAIRPEAHRLYMDFLEAFAPFFRGGRGFSDIPEDLPAEVEMLAIGAAEAIIFDEIMAGRAGGLADMMPAVLFSVLVPFLGPREASNTWQKAKKNG